MRILQDEPDNPRGGISHRTHRSARQGRRRRCQQPRSRLPELQSAQVRQHGVRRSADGAADPPISSATRPLEIIFAECLDHVGQYAAAERIMRRLTRATNRPLFWRQLGRLLEDRGCFGEALRCFQQCTRLEPDDTRNWIYKGCILLKMGRLREGERSHRRATQCGHGDVDEAWLNVGLCLRARRKYSEAATCFSRTLRMDPKYVAAKKALRDVCQAMSVVQKRR